MQVFNILQKYSRKKPKEKGKSNFLLPLECECIVNTFFLSKRTPTFANFTKKLTISKVIKKNFEIAKTSPFSL